MTSCCYSSEDENKKHTPLAYLLDIFTVFHKISSTKLESEKASKDWLYFFMKRHATLSIRKPEPTSLAWAAGFNKLVVMSFYDKLLKVKKSIYKFKPNEVNNLDETKNPTVLLPPNVIA
jgi:hypothetical protein